MSSVSPDSPDVLPSASTAMSPPAAPARPAEAGGDPYAWMRDAHAPAMLEHLAQERAYYDAQTAGLAALRDVLAAELAGRLPAAGQGPSWRQGEYRYFTRDLPGHNYQQFCRSEVGGSAAEVLLDENTLLDGPAGGYLALGVREVSPDGRLLAYSVDFDGDEVYQLRVRDLGSGEDLSTEHGSPERIERTYYGLAWSADSRSFFYTVTDAAYRPFQVWRHVVGGDPAADTLVYTEDDERFELTVRATRSGAFVFIESACRDTSETLFIPAADPAAPPTVIMKRRKGVEYRAEHAPGSAGGEFYLVTNEHASEFSLVKGPVPGTGPWTEAIAGTEEVRLVSCDVFAGHLVLTQRSGGATQLRVIDVRTGGERLIAASGPEVTLELAENPEYDASEVLVRTESLTEPPSWHEVDLVTGQWRLHHRQEAPGHDPAAYRTERITAPAPDGTPIPVTLAYRAGLRRDGAAPCLLYGYGAYESCEWPRFDSGVISLLDRGYVYAIAHIRGGGEGGRRWWLDGRLDRKKNTFTDFIAVADALADQGWVAGDRIVSRGLSAGGLLQGAVYSVAPGRWRGVVAEVPFVDVVNSMLDPTIPLTVNEWDEWGDPRDPQARAYLASYSPYDNVPAGPCPDLLVTGSLHDPRVLVHEPAKWVAKLRAAGMGRVLFRPELGAGAHVGPAGRYDKLAYEAEVLAWVLDVAGTGKAA